MRNTFIRVPPWRCFPTRGTHSRQTIPKLADVRRIRRFCSIFIAAGGKAEADLCIDDVPAQAPDVRVRRLDQRDKLLAEKNALC
jgi:hypothetical protein